MAWDDEDWQRLLSGLPIIGGMFENPDKEAASQAYLNAGNAMVRNRHESLYGDRKAFQVGMANYYPAAEYVDSMLYPKSSEGPGGYVPGGQLDRLHQTIESDPYGHMQPPPGQRKAPGKPTEKTKAGGPGPGPGPDADAAARAILDFPTPSAARRARAARNSGIGGAKL